MLKIKLGQVLTTPKSSSTEVLATSDNFWVSSHCFVMIKSLKERSITYVVGGQFSESSSDKINQKLDKIG